MKAVWRLVTATVHDVYEAHRQTRRIAYTTVMTMMNILEAKGYLTKETHDRACRYRPARPERAIVGSMVRELVNRVFDGASRPLLLVPCRPDFVAVEHQDHSVEGVREQIGLTPLRAFPP